MKPVFNPSPGSMKQATVSVCILLVLFAMLFAPLGGVLPIKQVQAAPAALPPETLYAGTDTGTYGDDYVTGTFDIGFSFIFYGNSYAQFQATTNGILCFGGGATNTWTNTTLPSSAAPNNCVYAFWDDLMSYGDHQTILYRTVGEVGSRMLIVQWTNYGYFSSDLPMGTFQVILYEGSNNIRTQYRQLLTETRSYGQSATIGLENSTGTVAVQYCYNTACLDPEQSILWTWNGVNNYTYDAGAAYEGVFLYKDNPPPTVPQLIAPANGSAGVSTSPTFSWHASTGADSYNLRVSTNSNLSSPIINVTGISGTSYAASGLSVGPTYYWGVEAINAYGNTWSSIWSFTTAAGNSAPNDIVLSNNTIAAGQPANTQVGTLSTIDPDVGDTHTYSLVSGGGSSDNGSFSIVGNSLRTAVVLSSRDYTIRIRSTDQGGLFVEEIFTITVSSTNSAPTDISLSSTSINENVAANSTVGTFSTTDPDAGDTHTYTLVAGTGSTDNASFNISGSSLRISGSPDYETQNSYSIRVRSTDAGGLWFERQFTITVNNVNETPTDINLSSTSINENVAANSTVGTFSTTDSDAGDTHTYTLVAGTGSTDNASFNISGSSLRISGSPDYETQNSYSIRVRSTDAGGLWFERQFTITITNLNEFPTAISLSNNSVAENQAINTVVGTFSTTDPDVGDTFTYTLVAGTGSTDNASFNISGSSLRISGSPDYETQNSYSIRVRSTDAGGLWFERQFTITVMNVNETPTDIVLSSTSINENVAANTTVGTFSTTDPDVGDTHTYTLVAGTGSTHNASFNISGNSLRASASFDYETQNSYSIRVRSTDAGGLWFERQFTITVMNVNETPTDIVLSNTLIYENGPTNTIVGFFLTADPDAGDTFTYTLVSGTGSTDNASFNISGSSLRASASFDYETQNSHSIRVRSTDAGGLWVERQFTIMVMNVVEDTTTTILSNLPNPSVYGQDYTVTVQVAPQSGGGTPTGTVNVSDGSGSCNITLAAGSGSCDLPSLAPATLTLTATYAGDANWNGSSDTASHTINRAASLTTIVSDLPDPSEWGFNYTVTVSVSAVAPGSGTPTGTVDVDDGLNSCTVTLSAGSGSCDLPSDAVSSRTITASYGGDANFDASADTEAHTIEDTTRPTVTINQAATQVDPTNLAPIVFDAVFSEPVTGFDGDDIGFAGSTAPGTLAAGVSGSGAIYQVSVSGMTGTGLVVASIPANSMVDGSGNLNEASTSTDNSVLYDITPPTVTINQASTQTDPTNVSPIVFDVVFSEAVTGFDASSLSFAGSSAPGTLMGIVSGSGTTYTVTVSGMTDSGDVVVAVEAGAAQDPAGNFSLASTSADNVVTYDVTDPTVTINQGSAQSDPTNASPIVFDVVFSEAVTGFDSADIDFSGSTAPGTLAAVVSGSGASYTVSVSGMTDTGDVVVSIPSGTAADAAGNLSEASTSTDNSVTYDVTPLTVTIEQGVGQADPTNASPIVFDVLFSKPVTGFDETGVNIAGMSAAATITVVGSGDTYIVEVEGMQDGETVTATIPADAGQDAATNGNQASTSVDNSVLYDITRPTVAINQGATQADPTNTSPITFDVVFSEDVTGFEEDDVVVNGMAGTALIAINGGGTTYTVEVSGMSDGETVTAEIAEDAAQDASGNLSEASTSTDNAVTYDISGITVIEAGVVGQPGNLVISHYGSYVTQFTQIQVNFDEDALNPAGNDDEDDVTNPANYYLIRPGANYVIDVTTCTEAQQIGISPDIDDILVPIGPVTYNNNGGAGPFVATLTVNNGIRPPYDKYRLLVCGSTSIMDLAMNPLNGGFDTVLDFTLQVLPAELPETGFPVGSQTILPAQPLSEAYNSTGLTLNMPTLNVSTPIIGVPLGDDGWDTTWLGNYAGYLEGSAFPTWNGNTVITGHVWGSSNRPGIFADLRSLQYGDEIKIHAWGQVFTYEVRSNAIITGGNVSSVLRSERLDWLTLLTCDSFDMESNSYRYRRVVRAVLVRVE